MERYFLSSDATPLEVRKLTTKAVIPREPATTVVFKGAKPYENCLRVYDQEKDELHYYQPVDWVLSDSIFDSLRFLGYVPVGEHYPYHKENQEQKAVDRLEEIYNKLSSVWETPREPKEDITREELEQEVEKLVSPFVGTPPPLGFDIFGVDALRKTTDELLSSTPKEPEFCDRFWVKRTQIADDIVKMPQYAGRKFPFTHVTDVGQKVLLIPHSDDHFFLYYDFKDEQEFTQEGNMMVDKKRAPLYSATMLDNFELNRVKDTLKSDYTLVEGVTTFSVYPKNSVWDKEQYVESSRIPVLCRRPVTTFFNIGLE